MNSRKHWLVVVVLALAVASLACNFLFGEKPLEPTPVSPVEEPVLNPPSPPENQAGGFSQIVFCSDVTEDGQPVNPGTVFPAGTRLVYAYFDYWGMQDGQAWGQYWTRNGELYIDDRQLAWEDGPDGWVAYYLDDATYLAGDFTLSLYIGDQMVQQGAFKVESAVELLQVGQELPAAFGTIQFSKGITEEYAPIGLANRFAEGVTEVYAVFPYYNIPAGQSWAREWIQDGESLGYRELDWEEGTDGLDYTFIYGPDDGPMAPGVYTLNLYLDGQLERSASFEVIAAQAEEEPEEELVPGTPEELVDPNLMTAFEILYYANPEILRDLAQFALDHRIQMILSDEIKSLGLYRCSTTSREPGTLYISEEYWKEISWEEVAATMAHELTHAVQHIEGGKCYCSVENEYYAYVTEFYVLQETGRMDLLEEKWRGAYNEDGSFDRNKLWAAIKDAYSECPEY